MRQPYLINLNLIPISDEDQVRGHLADKRKTLFAFALRMQEYLDLVRVVQNSFESYVFHESVKEIGAVKDKVVFHVALAVRSLTITFLGGIGGMNTPGHLSTIRARNTKNSLYLLVISYSP
jgi:hypothetical protein